MVYVFIKTNYLILSICEINKQIAICADKHDQMSNYRNWLLQYDQSPKWTGRQCSIANIVGDYLPYIWIVYRFQV